MELLFDTYEKRADVRLETEKFIRLMEIDPALHAPPVLVVAWASLQFRCVLMRANQKFILFLDDGRPVRARITANFTEFIDAEHEALQVKRETADYTKRHTVLQGETIVAIAHQYYSDPTLWRPIAIYNRLDDPHALSAGQPLLIPSLPYSDPATGEVIQ
jgi:nucleoid-associated protein YgaU